MRHVRLLYLLLAAALAGSANAQQLAPSPPVGFQPIIADWARARPVLARNGMVASQENTASRVGIDVLRAGGNAVDAAVAVGFALAVTLPRAGNIGGGGFMVVHLAGTGEQHAIDYREAAPAATTRDVFLDAQGRADPRLSRDGGLAVGVPGTVAGLALAHRRFGSGRMTLAQLVAPAVRLAREGITVDEDLADSLPRGRDRLARFPSSARIFLDAQGRAPAAGALLVQRDLADTLEAIGRDGPDAFYRGRTAERIAAAVREHGGRMTADDLAAYRAVERRPVRGRYRGFDVVSMPPPSSGGVHLVQILNILEGYDLAAMGQGSADAMHVMAEAMRRAYADRSRYLGDPDFTRVPVAGLTSRDYAAELRRAIDTARATPSASVRPGDPAPYESDQTTHYSVVDSAGNAVANTYTLNFSYGVGLVAEGTGVLLNNELDDFAAAPGASNAYGLVGDEANAPGPNRRPLSSMTPTILLRNNRAVLVTGSPGGSRIITTTLQLILGVVDHGLTVAEATIAPRMHHQWLPDELTVERGFSPDTLRLLRERGHRVVERPASGSTQSILVSEEGFSGFSDLRQRGTATVGY